MTIATAEVMADYYRFKQVLINLLSNAVKYNRVGGSITYVLVSRPKLGAGGWRSRTRATASRPS